MTRTTKAALCLAAAIGLAGCASMFTSKTAASYQVSADGTKLISYTSDKEENGLDATWENTPDGNVKLVHIKVDKAGAQESAVAAALQLQVELVKMLQALLPLAQAAAAKGAGS